MIGERLLDLRKDAGLTQDELALALNINKHSVSSYERSKSEPPDEIKIAIARFFHVSADYLLGLTDTPEPYGDRRDCLRLSVPLTEEELQAVRQYIRFLLYMRELERRRGEQPGE